MAVEAKRKAKIELTAGTAGMDRGLADAKRKLRAFERDQAKAARKAERDSEQAAKKVAAAEERAQKKAHEVRIKFGRRVLGSIGNGVGMALGGDLVSQAKDAISGVRDFERELTRFQIDAQLGGGAVDDFRQQIDDVSKATGQSRLEILKGAHAYQILTGDAESAVKVSKLFAEIANASGSSMDDIAAAAASMHNNLGFKASDFRQGFDVLLSMGHKSTVELRQFGAEMNRLTPLIKDFGSSSNVDKLAEMAASFETAAPAFKGSADEQAAAAEGMQQLLLTIRKPKVADRFAELGVKIWTIDPKTKRHVLRDWIDILGDIKKHVPDQMMLQAALGGRGQAYLALQEMIDNYQKLVQLKQQALGSDQVAKDNATYMASATGKLDVAFNKLKVTIAEVFTPDRIETWVSAIATLLDKASKAVSLIDFAFTGETGDQDADANAEAARLLDVAHTTGPYEEPDAQGVKRTKYSDDPAVHEAFAIEQAKADLASGDASKAAGGRKFLESEGYLFDANGKLRAGMGADADTASLLVRALLKLPTAGSMRAALAGALKDAGLDRNGNTRDPGPEVHVKIGAEPVQKAAANSIEHRRGRGY